jgi:hypothetical protein
MATTKAKDDQAGTASDESGVEIEQTRRLKVRGVVYEETTVNGQGMINVKAESIIEQTDLTEDDVDNIVRFFVGFQRRSRRAPGEGAVDGRGQVRDPSHDARLKGNEEQRPSDPDRSKQSGRAR